MYLYFQQIASSGSVQSFTDIAAAENAAQKLLVGKSTLCELQATAANISYTMDNVTDPTATKGMVLLTTEPPKLFINDDLKRIRFISVSGSPMLNIHFLAGRDV